MTNSARRVHDAAFKTNWKHQVLDGIPTIFESPTSKPTLNIEQKEKIENPLFQQIGQFKVENDWLKKKLRIS